MRFGFDPTTYTYRQIHSSGHPHGREINDRAAPRARSPRERGAYLVGAVRGRPDVDGVVTTGGGSNDVFRARFGACRAHKSSIVSI